MHRAIGSEICSSRFITGDEFCFLRKALDYSQTGLGEVFDVSENTILDTGLKFGFEINAIDQEHSVTLAKVFTELVGQVQTGVVLIIDEVQHALASEEGGNLLLLLKATWDAINPRPTTPCHFVFIGSSSH